MVLKEDFNTVFKTLVFQIIEMTKYFNNNISMIKL